MKSRLNSWMASRPLRPGGLLEAVVLAALIYLPHKSLACGPWFPNRLLTGSDDAVLVAPAGNFNAEIERMQLFKRRVENSTNTCNSFYHLTVDAEMADLREALTKAGVAPEKIDDILNRHKQERAKIVLDAAAEHFLKPHLADQPRIPQSLPDITPGLPPEFAEYFLGAIAWHEGVFPDARASWQKVLNFPAPQRHYKSTWSAYMLGKSLEDENPSKAIDYFRLVRSLTRQGFADRLDLSTESLGWEARLFLRQQKFPEAIELYVQQGSAGDYSAINSLRFAAAKAFENPRALRNLAQLPKTRDVLTAYAIAHRGHLGTVDVDGPIVDSLFKALGKAPYVSARVAGWHKFADPVVLWLEAIEKAQIKDVASAEKLALVAYQAGQMEVAQRWINRSKSTAISDWLQAKLLLREGKLEPAAALLSKVCQAFAQAPPPTNAPAKYLFQNLAVPEEEMGGVSVPNQVLGEYGVLQLARRQYTEALDALIRSGFWTDAAYIAEQVLTTDELKQYVDRAWPAKFPPVKKEDENAGEHSPPPGGIRYVLARRLNREGWRQEAGAYFPESVKPLFLEFAKTMQTAELTQLPREQRSAAYFEAAKHARWEGMELLGTEGDPDGAMYAGGYEPDKTLKSRLPGTNLTVIAASLDEQQRAARHAPSPNERYHYRYTAAALAWEAAKLMPDNSEETARVLCTAGLWLKNSDAKAADVFYKALVRRCRKTTLGAEADRKRWFPTLDVDGGEIITNRAPLNPPRNSSKKN